MNTKHFFIFLISMFIIACSNPPANVQVQKQEPVPKALEEDAVSEAVSSLKSYRGGYSIVDKLYDELCDNNAEYKAIEEQLDRLQKMIPDSTQPFYSYKEKSDNYYSAASHKTEQVSDSTLRKKLASMIKQSDAAFSEKIKVHSGLVENLGKNNIPIEDYHKILKVTATLLMMEKYQANNLPDKKMLQAVLKNQEEILKKIKEMNKKNGWKE